MSPHISPHLTTSHHISPHLPAQAIGYAAISGAVSHWFFFRDQPSERQRLPVAGSLWRAVRFHLALHLALALAPTLALAVTLTLTNQGSLA